MKYNEVNEWKEAILDALSYTGMDATIDDLPSSILRDIINWHVDVERFVTYTGEEN